MVPLRGGLGTKARAGRVICPACHRENAADAPERDPRAYTPKHLAEKILSSRATLQCARDCYTRFGMTAQAARVVEAMG